MTKDAKEECFQLEDLVARNVVVYFEDGVMRPILLVAVMDSEPTDDPAPLIGPDACNSKVNNFEIASALAVEHIESARLRGYRGPITALLVSSPALD